MSEQAKHTPGPWQVSPLDGRTCGPSRLLVSSGTTLPQMQAVAIVTLRAGETDANARLIAAAPDMLGTLKAFADRRTLTEQDREHIDLVIGKAEGRL
ncbi:MAG: hypothetical protein DMF56_27020 [Acidobacteria bacterium]|nr:MAG: hypothetical protein DMF56_27020 [Acidobacteriota bacterium]